MIEFRDVRFGYRGTSPPIFESLNITFKQGTTTALMGASGTGKTTLLKLACGLLKPAMGAVCIRNQPVRLGDVRGLIFHEDTLLPWLTVLGNVTFAPKVAKDIQERARGLLKQFGLENAHKLYPHELSEGMRKRVEFARAILSDDRMLLLDEPFVSLDRASRHEFWSLWRNSDAVLSRTKIIISHDLEEVKAIADEVVVLEPGTPVTVHGPRPAASMVTDVPQHLLCAKSLPKDA